MNKVIHHNDSVEWEIDHAAAATAMGWVARAPKILLADLEEMAEYFPHWLLAGTQDSQLVRCPRCANGLAVPTAGAMRCFICKQALTANGLSWLGQIPALARPEPAFERKQAALLAAGFGEVTSAGLTYLLVPLTVRYPDEWPNVQPAVRYSGRWLDLIGLPRGNASYHLVIDGQACIFSTGQWAAMTVAEVLQQRMINHIASLFKIVAGQKPHQAFIGRIH